jgi:hypothetical protein
LFNNFREEELDSLMKNEQISQKSWNQDLLTFTESFILMKRIVIRSGHLWGMQEQTMRVGVWITL